jgi:hypothetical protein
MRAWKSGGRGFGEEGGGSLRAFPEWRVRWEPWPLIPVVRSWVYEGQLCECKGDAIRLDTHETIEKRTVDDA